MNPIEVHYKNNFASIKAGNCLAKYMKGNFAIVCIGTDKCIIDSLGPLVGTLLLKDDFNGDVYGTLNKPVHAMNINEYIKKIRKKNYDKIIAIDACLSNRKNQGIIEIKEGPITPGKGIGKLLPEIGDISIIGVVDSSDKEFHDLVQDTRLSMIYEMAETICESVVMALKINDSIDDYIGDQASVGSI